MSSKLIKSDIKLTVGMLVSNHKQYIRRAMEALKPLLAAVPSELVVIDTKGEETDGSIAIVKEYTDKIYRFAWCDDFSAARNFCLEHSRGEWFMYQDDDEWFDDVTEFIDFFTSGECEKYYTGFYYTRDYMADGGYSMGIAGRMIRRTENTRFIGRVHETFNETFAPNREFSCFTHHYGYVYADDTAAKRKQERNLSILKKELAQVGYDPKLCAQMTQELLQREETAEAGVAFARDALRRIEQRGELTDSGAQWMLTAIVRYYTRNGSFEAVRQQAEAVESRYALSEVAQLVLAAVVARAAFDAGNAAAALQYADRYLALWDWKQHHEEEALLQTQLDFPRFYSERYYFDLIRIGALTANRRGDYLLANKYWKRLPLNQEGFDATPYYSGMKETMDGLKRQELQQMEGLIEEAAETVRPLVSGEKGKQEQEFLATLQELVINYGNKAEQYFGESRERDFHLEQCCEMLWRTANAEKNEEAAAFFEKAVDFFEKGKL